MANVKFLRGTLDKFNGLTSYTPGAFYLVMDSQGKPGRLYYGVSESLCSPVNQGITTVATQKDLPAANANNAGSFYYIQDGNILAICNGKGWIQTNTDTHLNSDLSKISVYASNDANSATIEESIQDSGGNEVNFIHNIVGSDNIKVEADGTGKAVKLSLNGVDYSLSLGLEGNKLNLKLNNGKEAKNTLAINAGDGVSFSKVSDTEYAISASSKVESFNGHAADNGDGFTFDLEGAAVQKGSLSTTIDPQIKIGSNGDVVNHFNGGQTTLNVYTIPEVDAKLRTLDAMVFRGSIGNITDGVFSFVVGGNSAFSSADLQVGDTFKYAGEDTLYNGAKIKAGDIFIASGTEDADGKITPATLSWTVIPSADEPLVEIGTTLTNNFAGFEINRGQEELLHFTIENADNSGLSITPTTNKDAGTKVISIGHTAVKKADKAVVSKSQSAKVPFEITVNDITEIDNNGHVLQVEPKTYTLTDTHATIDMADHTFGDNILYPTMKVDGSPVQLSPIEFTSDSLTLTSNSSDTGVNAKLNLELEWGTF